jgi:hypothetical protein
VASTQKWAIQFDNGKDLGGGVYRRILALGQVHRNKPAQAIAEDPEVVEFGSISDDLDE